MSINSRKVAIIGCGMVGSTTAYTLMQQGLFSEIVLIDVNAARAEGEAMDINHGMTFASPMKIRSGTYDDIVDAAIIIITAGASQRPGETRLDLVKKNAAIFRGIIPEITSRHYEGILLVVANPVDILTHITLKLSGFPSHRVFGSGTVLDTARLRFLLGQYLSIDNRNVHAVIIGEHGDSEIPVWSKANIAGMSIEQFCQMRGLEHFDEDLDHIAESVKNSAYEIIKRKKATYYGIAMAIARICSAIVSDEKSALTVSCYLDGEYGLHDVTLSVPAIVGKNGVEHILPFEISDKEQEALAHSARVLKETTEKL
jgi:L-lactate dehydrogenase